MSGNDSQDHRVHPNVCIEAREGLSWMRVFLAEMRFRPWGVLFALVLIAAVTASVAGTRALGRSYAAETDRMLDDVEKRSGERMRALNDEARMFSKHLGFDVLLLPSAQDVGRFWERDESDVLLEQSVGDTLAQADLETINHLLPILRQRHEWKEFGGTVVLIGLVGEIFIKDPKRQKPIEQSIAAGTIVLGAAVAERMRLTPGATVAMSGRSFSVSRIQERRGNADDLSVLMHLGDLQGILGKAGKISGILALSCECTGGAIEPIRAELARFVDDIQVVSFTVNARARHRARTEIRRQTSEAIADIAAGADRLAAERERQAWLLVGMIGSAALIALSVTAAANLRERQGEIAILRALGVSGATVAGLILARSAVVAVLGSALGLGTGLALARGYRGAEAGITGEDALIIAGAAALMVLTASAIPAIAALFRDPARVLSREY